MAVPACPGTFRALDEFAHVIGATVNLAAHAVQVDPVLHGEIHTEIIVLVSGHTALAGAEGDCFRRFQPAEPGKHVDVVDVLFHDVVSRQPFPVHPVADHEFEIVPRGLAVAVPQHALVPVNGSTGNFPDKAVHDLLVRFNIGALVVALRAGNHA
ncbi:hypothetical protein SDC9_199843 [bioreactor metagenome]|uniref:Uncharacterized protein n=1 Tax=bioreactor metagenome TaxID=1076179 RepID=A0A645ILP8_9ZZZZ